MSKQDKKLCALENFLAALNHCHDIDECLFMFQQTFSSIRWKIDCGHIFYDFNQEDWRKYMMGYHHRRKIFINHIFQKMENEEVLKRIKIAGLKNFQ